jgi:hypothetical protein
MGLLPAVVSVQPSRGLLGGEAAPRQRAQRRGPGRIAGTRDRASTGGGLRGYAKVVYNVDLTLEETQRFRNTFFESYRGIAAWHQKVKNTGIKESRTLTGGEERGMRLPK